MFRFRASAVLSDVALSDVAGLAAVIVFVASLVVWSDIGAILH